MEGKALKKLKSQRWGLKMNVQKQLKAKNDIIVDTTPDKTSIDKLHVIQGKLKEYLPRIEELDERVINALPDDDDDQLTAETEEASQFLEDILDAIQSIDVFLANLPQDNTQNGPPSEAGSSTIRVAKLPKLEIDPYDGDPMKWQEFWDIFSTTIDQHEDLRPVDKLKYLKSYLKGDALSVVAGYRMTADNYDQVVQVLREKFGDPEIAIHAHMEKLLAVRANPTDPGALQHIYYECEKHIRSLVALGMEESTFGRVFAPIILDKLPKATCIHLHRINGSSRFEFAELRRLLKEEIQAREMSQRYSKSTPESKGPQNAARKSQNGSNRQSFITQSTLARPSKAKVSCGFCGGPHYADKCEKFKTAEERKGALLGHCFRCLNKDHMANECKRKNVCFYCKSERHHSSLCPKQFGTDNSNSNQDATHKPFSQTQKPSNSDKNVCSSNAKQSQRMVQMKMAVIRLTEKVYARAFLDTGCSCSYITTGLCRKLGLIPSDPEVLLTSVFGARSRDTETLDSVDVQIPVPGEKPIPISALVQDHIVCDILKYPIDPSKHPILTQIPLADCPVTKAVEVPVDILIGEDYYDHFVLPEVIWLDNGMKLTASKFGYLLHGQLPKDHPSVTNVKAVKMHVQHIGLSNQQIDRFWSIEDIGIKADPYTDDDDRALQHFNSTVQFNQKEQRYEVEWPWRFDNPELSSHYGLAMGCLQGLIRRLQKHPESLKQYHEIIQGQLASGVIEAVPSGPAQGPVHYIPHHHVVKQSSETTKVRIVHNASAKRSVDESSLNEHLLRGPVILESLVGILIRFRLGSVGMISDVEKAFLQVMLKPSQRDVTRFVWLRNPFEAPYPSNMIEYRFCRVPFGFISSPFLLEATILHHMRMRKTSSSLRVAKNIYVDNVVTSVDDVEAAATFYRDAKALFNEISMNVREWYTNSKELVSVLEPKDIGKSNSPKVLGLSWNVATDTLTCPQVDFDAEGATVTKRRFLQVVSSLFDPCGFLSPVVIQGKIAIQDMWISKLPWDEPLHGDMLGRCRSILSTITKANSVEIPRHVCQRSTKFSTFELHCFTDASRRAYAAVVYLRSTSVDNRSECCLLFAKARLGPIKQISIPRLELLAILIGVRMLDMIRTEIGLPIAKSVLWSDAKCALHWLHSNRLLTTFVENQVKNIRKVPDVTIRYVPSAMNPADIPTRGCPAEELHHCQLWWTGPSYLQVHESMWPENQFQVPCAAAQEVRKSILRLSNPQASNKGVGAVIDIAKFSSLRKLLLTTAYVLRWVSRSPKSSPPAVHAAAIVKALRCWIQYEQRVITDGEKSKWGMFCDPQGLMRCAGRFSHAKVPGHIRWPIYVPRDSTLAKLLIMSIHENSLHAGARQTLAELRTYYWVPRAASVVKSLLHKCNVCRRFEGGPFQIPPTPSLPDYRVSREVPFNSIGVDYLGPLKISLQSIVSKVWICLFTCAVTRAVHLEVVLDNTAEQFLMALRRFCSIHTTPERIISDNAKTFKLADDVLKSIFHSSKVQRDASSRGIQWMFIPALSPWMGGFYERLVGSVKRALRKTLGCKCLTLLQLQTVCCEVSSVINSRPLVPGDLEVGEIALTPAHLLGKTSPGGLHNVNLNATGKLPAKQIDLLASWKKGRKVVEEFWLCWLKEYLPYLRQRQDRPLSCHNSSNIPIKPGTVVIVKEQGKPRILWKFGVIHEAVPGRDGLVRHAVVRLGSGNLIQRPLRLLYPIEGTTSSRDQPQRKQSLQANPPTGGLEEDSD